MKKILAIVGPTASGKTTLAVNLAEKLNGEIISADSRQVYRYIPIATSQPSATDLERVKHYFINELSPEDEFNAGEFGIKGREIIRDIFKRNKIPVIAGGSGLYVRSLIDGFFEEKSESVEIRNHLYEKLEKCGEQSLYDELRKVDEVIHEKIPSGKIRRVIRALEAYYTTGVKMSELQKAKTNIDFNAIQIGLMFDRMHLYKRINQRVESMIKEGLIEEAAAVIEMGYDYKKHYSVDTVGLKEVFRYFDGEYSLDEMINLIKQNTRRYAKRQLTWFRKDKRINWINAGANTKDAEILSMALEIFKRSN